MRVDLFDFDLPPELIAQAPVRPRDAARLLLVDGGPLREAWCASCPDLLRPGRPAGAQRHPRAADPLLRPARRGGRRGDAGRADRRCLLVGAGAAGQAAAARATVSSWHPGSWPRSRARTTEGRVRLDFALARRSAAGRHPRARRHAAAALHPPRAGGDAHDRDDYQTVFARREGAVAAPTASLHLTEELLARLDAAGIERCCVTLHVGAGTFAPVKVEDTAGTACTPNGARCREAAAAAIAAARARGGRIVAVGTTVLRTLESAVDADGRACCRCAARPACSSPPATGSAWSTCC